MNLQISEFAIIEMQLTGLINLSCIYIDAVPTWYANQTQGMRNIEMQVKSGCV